MSDEKKDSTDEKPEQLTDEQLEDVVGAGKFTKARMTSPVTVTDGVNNDTLIAGPGVVGDKPFAGGGLSRTFDGGPVKGIDKLKR